MRALKRCARVYGTAMRVSLTSALQYRSNVISGFLFYTLFLYVFFCLWSAIYREGSVEGLTLTQLIWYLCITEIISYGTRSTVCRDITDDVKSGAVAYQLLRPYRYISYTLATTAGKTAFSVAAYTLLALVIGFVFVGPIQGFQMWTLPFSFLSILIGMLINFFMHMAIGLTAFRLEDNGGINLIYQKCVFMLGTFIPLDFLPKWFQVVAKNLPFSYVSWAPARIAVSFSWELYGQLLPKQLFWLAVSIGLAALLYRSGMKGLQSHGG